jgi:putative transposase
MARKPRSFSGDIVYHVMNRASARAKIFHTAADYAAFETVLEQAILRFNLRLLTYIVMPNHFHLVLWPRKREGDKISPFMKWLQQTHTQRWHAHFKNSGEGRLYQGRFKAFPIQSAFNDFHFLRKVCRYVERNPLRANLVKSADLWQPGALWRRLHGTPESRQCLAPWPAGAYPGDKKWLATLHQPLSSAEEKALAQSLHRQSPFGAPVWQTTTAKFLNLEHTLRSPGRPKKEPDNHV